MSFRKAVAQANAFHAVVERSALWFAISLALAAGLGIVAPLSAAAYGAAGGIAIFSGVVVVASLRYYQFWLSWVVWLLPLVPIAFVFEPLRTGSISVLATVFVYALAVALMFGVFFVGREPLRKWVMRSAF